MTAGVTRKILAPIMGGFATTSLQKGRSIPFSLVDPQVGSFFCSHVRRQFGATQSHLVRRGKGADEYSLTSTLP